MSAIPLKCSNRAVIWSVVASSNLKTFPDTIQIELTPLSSVPRTQRFGRNFKTIKPWREAPKFLDPSGREAPENFQVF